MGKIHFEIDYQARYKSPWTWIDQAIKEYSDLGHEIQITLSDSKDNARGGRIK